MHISKVQVNFFPSREAMWICSNCVFRDSGSTVIFTGSGISTGTFSMFTSG